MKNRKMNKVFCLMVALLLCGCSSKVNNNVDQKASPTETKYEKQDLEYVEKDSTLVQYEIKKDNTIEITYLLSIINNTEETKYFYLRANMAKEDDNLVKEDVIPAYDKKTKDKAVFMLEPNQGKDEYFYVTFKGTHGSQELKETKNALATGNLIIDEISEKDIPKNADIKTVKEEW